LLHPGAILPLSTPQCRWRLSWVAVEQGQPSCVVAGKIDMKKSTQIPPGPRQLATVTQQARPGATALSDARPARMKIASHTELVLSSGPGSLGDLQPCFGFKTGQSGAHAARTMMLADLTTLLAAAPHEAKRNEFNRLIVEENVLGKRTTSNRWLTARHLADLYGLDSGVVVFRLMRFFWAADSSARPMLALLCAFSRDPLLRASAEKVLELKTGETVNSGDFIAFFNQRQPGRFSESTLRSLAQNVAASWTHGGFFSGKIQKVRTKPQITSATAAYALLLGYLCGLRGQLLLESPWARLLDIPRDQVIADAQQAAKRGWLDFKGAGNVFEINFQQLLTGKEIQLSHGTN